MDQGVPEAVMPALSDVGALYALGLRTAHTHPELRGLLDKLTQDLARERKLPFKGGYLEAARSFTVEQLGELLWEVNKLTFAPGLRASLAEAIARKSRAASGWSDPTVTDAGLEFQRDGLFQFDRLVTAGQAAEMYAYFKNCPDRAREDTVLHHRTRDVLQAPHVMRIATDGRVLSLAQEHLGMRPTIVDVTAWWSLAEGESPHGAQIFHRDRDDFRACKLFVYLSDVATGDGPHVFVRGSHRPDFIMQAMTKNGLPAEASARYFAGNGRGVAGTIGEVFGDAVTEIVGPAGTCFLENTYGFHRGKIPRIGSRCILQVLYAAIPYPHRLKRLVLASPAVLPSDAEGESLARHAARHFVC